MAKKHYSHKQIRQSMKHDEIREWLQQAYTFGKAHLENLLISAIILGVIAVLVPLYFQHQAESERRAAGLLNRALSTQLQPLAGAKGTQNNQGFRTLEEKYKKTQQAYEEVANTYPNTQAAKLARQGAGEALFMLKEYQKAMALYQGELTRYRGDLFAEVLRLRIAKCQEGLGRPQDALATYQEILKSDSQTFNRHAIHLAMAACYAQLKQTSEAEKLLQAEAAENPGSYWAETARQQLVLLGPTAK